MKKPIFAFLVLVRIFVIIVSNMIVLGLVSYLYLTSVSKMVLNFSQQKLQCSVDC